MVQLKAEPADLPTHERGRRVVTTHSRDASDTATITQGQGRRGCVDVSALARSDLRPRSRVQAQARGFRRYPSQYQADYLVPTRLLPSAQPTRSKAPYHAASCERPVPRSHISCKFCTVLHESI